MGQIGVALDSLSPEGRGRGEGARTLQKNLQLPNPLILSFSPNSASKTRVNALMGRRDAMSRPQLATNTLTRATTFKEAS
jgi:hypothetical protein